MWKFILTTIIIVLLLFLLFSYTTGNTKKYIGYVLIGSSLIVPAPITPPLIIYVNYKLKEKEE